VRASSYDLVLMDVQMPGMDGLEATRRIRAVHGPARPRIVALTGEESPQERQHCLDAGMDDFVTKPVSGEALAGLLVRLRG
jgi:CheY-like chemotaxis protein